MRIKELIEKEEITYLDNRVKLGTDVVPSTTFEKNQPYILYICKKAMGKSQKITNKDIIEPLPYALVIDDERECDVDIPIIRVKDARKSLALAYSRLNQIDYEKFKIIGVTGTNGKTTTATILYKILRYCNYNVGFIGTGKIIYNDTIISDDAYSMTTPDPAYLYSTIKKMQDAGVEYIVSEVSSHSIKLRKIDAIPFYICAFTNLSNEHLDFHTDLEDYYKTKFSLFEKCQYGVFNLDDAYSKRAYNESSCERNGVGILSPATAYATEINLLGLEGSEFSYQDSGVAFGINLKLIGAMNIYNALMAIKCASILNIPPCDIRRAINEIEYIKGRMCLYQGKTRVIIDYAHTPDAYLNILKTLKSALKPRQKLITVFGCGGERDKEKRPLIGSIVSKYADKIIITEDNSRSESTRNIIADITCGMPEDCVYTVIPHRPSAVNYAISIAGALDIVAIIGKGDERYICNKDGKHSYSDEQLVLTALQKGKRV